MARSGTIELCHRWHGRRLTASPEAGGRPAASRLLDVAHAAGVSLRTASRVLNDDPRVAPVTRQRVREAMLDLRFEPDAMARSLRAGNGHRGRVRRGVHRRSVLRRSHRRGGAGDVAPRPVSAGHEHPAGPGLGTRRHRADDAAADRRAAAQPDQRRPLLARPAAAAHRSHRPAGAWPVRGPGRDRRLPGRLRRRGPPRRPRAPAHRLRGRHARHRDLSRPAARLPRRPGSARGRRGRATGPLRVRHQPGRSGSRVRPDRRLRARRRPS